MKTLLGALICLALFSLSPSIRAEVFVMVHGGWGNGTTFKGVEKLLTGQGHTVFRPTMTGLGEREHLGCPDTSLETHIQDIANVVRYEQLYDIILIGQSYGGMVATGVADRIPDRIRQLIYVEGLIPEDGESVLDIHQRAARNFERLHQGNVVVHPRYRANGPFPQPGAQPVRTITDKIHLTGAGNDIPTAYILTVDKGKTAEKDAFFPQAQRAKSRDWPVITLTGDHNIQRSQPAKLVETLLKIIQSGQGQSTPNTESRK